MAERLSSSAAARRAVGARWGAPRGASVQVRVDADAAAALRAVPERDRRRVASEAIRRAAAELGAAVAGAGGGRG